jgi:GT2 family glycosyltransferase
MARPLLKRECDVTVGPLKLAEELRKPWMTENVWVGISAYHGPPNESLQLVGANMGFHRSVFERVPAFDPEIGAGALGFFEDTLFGWQLAEAGFRLRFVPEASVIHYQNTSRFIYRYCLSERAKYGASQAYVLHHWQHQTLKAPWWRFYYMMLKLSVRRFVQTPPPPDSQGMPPWEASYLAEIAMHRQFLIERRRPRNYGKQGLIKVGGLK